MQTHTRALALTLACALVAQPAFAGFQNNTIPPAQPDSMQGWNAAYQQSMSDWNGLQQSSGLDAIDVFANLLVTLHNHGYSARALLELSPTLYFDVSGYMGIPFTILWTRTATRTGVVSQATCWYQDPGGPPYCVEGDWVTGYGPLPTQISGAWTDLVGLLVGLEAGWNEMASPDVHPPQLSFSEDCPARSCRDIRYDQVSFGTLLRQDSDAASAVTSGALVGAGTGFTGGLGFTAVAKSAFVGVGGAATLEGGAGLVVLLVGATGAGLVIGSLAGAALARSQYIASGTVLGFQVGGGVHRCGNCGEVDSPYEGWTVDSTGLNCGDASCAEEGACEPNVNSGDNCAGDDPNCDGPKVPTQPPGHEHPSGSGIIVNEVPSTSDGECEVFIPVSGDDCAACQDMDPNLYLPESDPECEDGGCDWSCSVCVERNHSQIGTISSCSGAK